MKQVNKSINDDNDDNYKTIYTIPTISQALYKYYLMRSMNKYVSSISCVPVAVVRTGNGKAKNETIPTLKELTVY